MANWYLLRNGQTHGPYPEETIREWIKSGQIGPEERLNREGDPNWLSVDMIPEFAGPAPTAATPPGVPPTVPPGTPFATPSVSPSAMPPIGTGVGSWLSEAWRLVTANLGSAIVVSLAPFALVVVIGIILGVSGFPAMLQTMRPGQVLSPEAIGALLTGSLLLGSMISLVLGIVLGPALVLGASACFWDMIRTGTLTTEKLLSGVSRFFSVIGWGLAFVVIGGVAGFVTNLVPVIGQLLAFLITFPLMAWQALSLYDMVARNVGAIEGISAGWSILSRDWLNLGLMGLAAYVIMIVGTLLCCVGNLVAFPVTQTAWGCAYRDLTAKR
ncbi:MAG: DUF4339 domain-containing protein [Armatimonadia bacterium]